MIHARNKHPLLPKYLAEKQKKKRKQKKKQPFDILKPETAPLVYKSFTPQQWIDQQNLMAEINHEGLEFEEVPEDQKHQPNIWRQEKTEKIDRERKAIFRSAKNKRWTVKKDFNIDEICFGWEVIAGINATRAIIEIRKSRLIKSEPKNWILSKINETSKISPTKLYSIAFREREYKTMPIAKRSIDSSLKSMINEGVIELINGNGYRYYKLLNVEFDNDAWLKIIKGDK